MRFNTFRSWALLLAVNGACHNAGKSERTLSVSGEASVATVPDRVEISIGMESADKSVKEVKSLSDQAMARILAAAKALKIEDKNIQTDFARIDADMIQGPDGRMQRSGYVVRRSVRILLTDINAYDALVESLFDAGANLLSDVTFSSSKKIELEKEARRLAIGEAKQKAELMAKELGLTVGQALEVHDSAANDSQPQLRGGMMQSKMMGDAALPTIAAGQIVIPAQVSIIFELN